MTRRVKKIIYIQEKKPRYFIVNLPTTVPRLRYHGVDPATIAKVELDIYIPDGERIEGKGYPMKYSHIQF